LANILRSAGQTAFTVTIGNTQTSSIITAGQGADIVSTGLVQRLVTVTLVHTLDTPTATAEKLALAGRAGTAGLSETGFYGQGGSGYPA